MEKNRAVDQWANAMASLLQTNRRTWEWFFAYRQQYSDSDLKEWYNNLCQYLEAMDCVPAELRRLSTIVWIVTAFKPVWSTHGYKHIADNILDSIAPRIVELVENLSDTTKH